MVVRSIRPEELDWFAGFGGDDWLADHIRNWWKDEGGQSAPDRCFVAEQDGRLVGRVLFFNFASSPKEQAMCGLHLDWQTDCLECGRTLLTEALAQLLAKGAESVGYCIYDIYQKSPELQCRVVEAAEFRLVQEKLRFVWKDPGHSIEVPTRLSFRALADVGESEFVVAVQQVTEGTLDREDRARISEVGTAAFARHYVDLLKDIDNRPDSWLLAYLPNGKLCGLVVPQRLDDEEGCINYIGVVPELRGNGYGLDLLLRGTAALQSAGWKKAVAEIDTENRPLARHLEQAGYRHHGTMRCYRYDFVR